MKCNFVILYGTFKKPALSKAYRNILTANEHFKMIPVNIKSGYE